MEYRRPERDLTGMGPHRSTNTRSNGQTDLLPSLTDGTGERVCLPRMHRSHLGGEVERSTFIPSTTLERAMSMIVRVLQWPRRRCQVSTLGMREAYRAIGEGRGGTDCLECVMRGEEQSSVKRFLEEEMEPQATVVPCLLVIQHELSPK